ncbi:hypothetical protein T10_9614 [Trichinella papuae]|uniref:Uncharacterized protein n=1 Tax=Trichinella papuae TaxID=268474 RepID=A0A0V1MDJ4_9BILA|nr:hypothetical protein T10_9614 [Trichinella papuae]
MVEWIIYFIRAVGTVFISVTPLFSRYTLSLIFAKQKLSTLTFTKNEAVMDENEKNSQYSLIVMSIRNKLTAVEFVFSTLAIFNPVATLVSIDTAELIYFSSALELSKQSSGIPLQRRSIGMQVPPIRQGNSLIEHVAEIEFLQFFPIQE